MVFSEHDLEPPLLIAVRHPAGDAVAVTVAGELDRDTSGDVHVAVRQAVTGARPAVVRLDLSEVTFADSAGLRALLDCRQVAQQAGARLEITAVHDNVRQVIEVTGLAALLRLPAPG